MALEDEFSDVLTKAMRGARHSVASVARNTGLGAGDISAWAAGRGVPDEQQARTLAGELNLDPGKFADAAGRRWNPEPITLTDVRHHPQLPHPSNGYVFFLDGGKRAALVDPAGIPGNLLKVLRDGKYHLEYILITHKHADHCDATADVAMHFPNAKIVMHAADVHAIGSLAQKATRVKDGEELPFGDVRIRMLHTPGHTDGSSSYLFKSTLFTGDTLFAGSVGGAYGDATTYADILNSVRSKIFTLPDDTIVMPGHGPPSKVGWEKLHNPFFPNGSTH
ncbi:MAG TPA: MBL fold metallo-hydrolase [Candidatus Baltobacteraceae bacterium]|jgi:glyoxylase-like metal-dependent hydrolase (beta-lactamase superfamily II)|nr:MBL fold metallo-hydrolase [Candidatus Baltobacteraceae bacterium]